MKPNAAMRRHLGTIFERGYIIGSQQDAMVSLRHILLQRNRDVYESSLYVGAAGVSGEAY